jgi:hypothetical protein
VEGRKGVGLLSIVLRFPFGCCQCRELCMGLTEADNLCSVKTLYITPIIPHKIGIDRIVLQSNIGIVIRITHRSYTNRHFVRRRGEDIGSRLRKRYGMSRGSGRSDLSEVGTGLLVGNSCWFWVLESWRQGGLGLVGSGI